MTNETHNGVPKVHPASREMVPEDPMEMQGFEVPGDTELMLRLLVEEYARMGWDTESIMRLACDPNYMGFHGLLRMYGEANLRSRIENILARCGVIRAKTQETESVSEQLVQLELPK